MCPEDRERYGSMCPYVDKESITNCFVIASVQTQSKRNEQDGFFSAAFLERWSFAFEIVQQQMIRQLKH